MELSNSPEIVNLPSENNQRQAFLDRVEKHLEIGGKTGVALDFDDNIACDGALDPDISETITEIASAGWDVVIISARGAKDIRERMGDIPVSIVGTLGWETLGKDGLSHIDNRFLKYKDPITDILREIRERFFKEQLNISTEIKHEPNSEIATPAGKITLQRKGYNDEYPEGINSTWALSMVNEEARAQYQQALKDYYHEAFDKHARALNNADREELREMCGFIVREGKTANDFATIDIEIRPISDNPKAKALLQLMREPTDRRRRKLFKDMPYDPLWICSGDNPSQDGAAMRAVHSADKFTGGKRGGLGIWTKKPGEEGKEPRGVDVVVNGVGGNTELMRGIAGLATRYPRSAK